MLSVDDCYLSEPATIYLMLNFPLKTTTIAHPNLPLSILHTFHRYLSRSQNLKRTSNATRSSTVVVARVRLTTANVSDYAARLRTSTKVPSTVSSFASRIVRLFVKSPIHLLMVIVS